MKPGSPYHKAVVAERARLQALLQARTDGDGKPKKGFKANVARIRAMLAKLPETPDA